MKQYRPQLQALWDDPVWREKQLALMRDGRNSPECQKKKREKMKALWDDPEWKARQLEKMRAGANSPEAIQRRREQDAIRWADPEFRAARWERMKKRGFSEKIAKLTDDDVREVREMLEAGWMVSEIAEFFRVSQPIISYIKAGKTYKRVKQEPDEEE